MEYLLRYRDANGTDGTNLALMTDVYEVLDDFDRYHERILIPADSIDIEGDIIAALPAPYTRKSDARTAATNVPNWATWDEASAESWWQTNIQDPLDAAPATVTAGNVVAVVQGILPVLGAMSTMLWALARMIIAIRDHLWDLS